MKLKKLEISGFKSFLDKADIEFPSGISAVVGPNGCGKSNIVDALRWVMGEQSVKQLRGKSMDDIIFAGADGKSPLNMAEVSLTLVNDNGSAPEELKDFSEIMITRRQYRSGERCYFLNKKPCRLKDIHNIFLGSGMGVRSYSVIQQGNIGAITDAGPQERRFFVEEAAGVTRYKNRKNEAIRKLNATRQNLLRIDDIIAEVKRQMNGLKRQARKAEQYKEFKNRKRNSEITASSIHFDELGIKIRETDSMLKELRDMDITNSSRLASLDAEIEKIKLERSVKGREIAEHKSKRFEAQRKTDRIENDLEHLRKNYQLAEKEIKDLESARVELGEKNKQLDQEVFEVMKEMKAVEEEEKNRAMELQEEDQSSRKISSELSKLNEVLEGEKKYLMELVADEARHKNIYQNASNNRESLRRRLKRIDEEEVLAKRKVIEFTKKSNDIKAELEEINKDMEGVLSRIKDCENQLNKVSTELGQKIKLVQTIDNERGMVKSSLKALRKMDENFEWYKDGVKAVMQRGRSGNDNDGTMVMMADVLEPMPGFETAVEAVLGESMQFVIVADRKSGMEGVEYLRETRAGRAGFVPLGGLQGECIGKSAGDSLLDHLKIRQGFENVGGALLSNVFFAGDLDEAMNLWDSKKREAPATVVTKDGDLISANGVISGGSKDKLSGILIKKQEIRELDNRLAAIDRRLDKERIEQSALEEKVRGAETKLQKLIKQKNMIKEDEINLEKSLYKSSEELKHAERHFEIVCLEQEQLLGEESEIDDEIVKNNEALQAIERVVKEKQETVAMGSDKIRELAYELENFNKRAVEKKLILTKLNARLDNGKNTLSRMKSFQDDGKKRFEHLAMEIRRKKEKMTSMTEKIEEFDKALPSMYEEIKKFEQDIDNNEAEFLAMDANLSQSDKKVADIQGERAKNLERIRFLEVEQSKSVLKQENIKKRIEERYHKSFAMLHAEADGLRQGDSRALEEIEQEINELGEKIGRIGDVNLAAINEYQENTERFEFLGSQRQDLVKALDDINKVIKKINKITQERFMETFNLINEKLSQVFPRLFKGGTARLELTDPGSLLETGVEFMVHPHGKKLTRLSLLSGGEKALCAIAFIFSIFLLKPASFCLMDEIDAPLDEANVLRFNELVKMIGEKSQIVMITHNKNSMEFADMLFGVTMEKKGVSKIVSVDFDRSFERSMTAHRN